MCAGWYVWNIRADKFDIVSRYFDEKVPEVLEYLYTTVTAEKRGSKGTVKKVEIPLYAGYLFLRYTHDVNNPDTWWKIKKHPFVLKYVGPCTAHDLASVASMKKVRYLNLDDVKNFITGDSVMVNGGVFKGFEGTVTGTSSNSVCVLVSSLGKTIKVVFSPADLNITYREGS